MYRCALAAIGIATTLFVGTASAQALRVFPPGTLRGTLVFGEYPSALLNGRPAQLAPGSRVRDVRNMQVMPPTIAGTKLLVHYTVDPGANLIKDVWLLTADEAAIKPWPTTLDEARTWTYDSNARTWTKP